MSSLSTQSVSWFNQAWSYISSGQKKENVTTQEIETHLRDKNAGFVGKRTPTETLTFAGGIFGSILWLCGLSKDNSSLKWSGGILTLAGLGASTILALVFGWAAASADSTSNANKPEAEASKDSKAETKKDDSRQKPETDNGEVQAPAPVQEPPTVNPIDLPEEQIIHDEPVEGIQPPIQEPNVSLVEPPSEEVVVGDEQTPGVKNKEVQLPIQEPDVVSPKAPVKVDDGEIIIDSIHPEDVSVDEGTNKKIFKYEKPTQLGDSKLWLYHYDDLPGLLKRELEPSVQYFIVDSSLYDPVKLMKHGVVAPRAEVTVGRKYAPSIPAKGFREGEVIKIKDFVGVRFAPGSDIGVENLKLSREGNNICVEALPRNAQLQEVNPELEYVGRPLILMDGAIDGGVYLGAGGEAIVVDKRTDSRLNILYLEVKQRLPKNVDPKDTLEFIYNTVRHYVRVNPQIGEILESKKWDGDRKVSIDYFIEKGGICRHFALVYGAVIERAIEEGLLKGKVSIDGNYTPDKGGHAWCRFTEENGTPWILDGTMEYCGKLKDCTNSNWTYARPGDGQDKLLEKNRVKWDTAEYMKTLLKVIHHTDDLSSVDFNNSLGLNTWTKKLLGFMKNGTYNVSPAVAGRIQFLDENKRNKIKDCLVQLLQSQDNDEVKNSIYLLSVTKHEPAIDRIVECLRTNKDFNVQLASILALGNFKNTKCVEALTEALKTTNYNPLLLLSTAMSLGRIGELSIEPLVKCLSNDVEPAVRARVEALLVGMQDVSVKKLLEAFNNSVQDVQRRILRTLSQIDESSVNPLIEGLLDSRPDVAHSAADILINIGNVAIEPLFKTVQDGAKTLELRQNALIPLIIIARSNPNVYQRLEALSNNDTVDPIIRCAIKTLIAREQKV